MIRTWPVSRGPSGITGEPKPVYGMSISVWAGITGCTELQGALLLSQLRKLPEQNARRQKNVSALFGALQESARRRPLAA